MPKIKKSWWGFSETKAFVCDTLQLKLKKITNYSKVNNNQCNQ